MNRLTAKLSQIDYNLLHFIHTNRIEFLDGFLYYLSFLTTYVTVSIFVILLFFYIKSRKKTLLNSFLVLLSIVLSSGVITFFLKELFSRERPFHTYEEITKLSQAGSMSFPSGHTAEAFAIAFGLSFLFPNKKIVIPIFIWASLVGYSRMALGVHYPLDVIAGILLSLVVSILVFVGYKKFLIKK
jgi:undecaprenyl-diphosphatase